jgi:exopolysaccharide biosynthesis polyprenyl glycosylphosphotransferase
MSVESLRETIEGSRLGSITRSPSGRTSRERRAPGASPADTSVSPPTVERLIGAGERRRLLSSTESFVLIDAGGALVSLAFAHAVATMVSLPVVTWNWSLVMAVVALAVLALAGAYRPKLQLGLGGSGRSAIAASVGALVALTGQSIVSGRPVEPLSALLPLVAIAVALPIARRLALGPVATMLHIEPPTRKTMVIGAGEIGRRVAERVKQHNGSFLEVVAFFDPDPLEGPVLLQGGPPLLGADWRLEEALTAYGVDHVIVAFSRQPHDELLEIMRRCQLAGVSVSVVPRLFERTPRTITIEHLGGLPVMTMHARGSRDLGVRLKYLLDRVVAALALLLLAPVLLAVALAIRLRMGSPVLFRQKRVGRDGTHFELLKFRSMTIPKPGEEASDAARVTRLGRLLRGTSLDELPQLINVLRGEMSLVGPRPETPGLVSEFEIRIRRYSERHRVKSGITGWAQVHGIGRGDDRFSDPALSRRVEWDNYYVENWSPWLDMKIIYMTLQAILRFRQV